MVRGSVAVLCGRADGGGRVFIMTATKTKCTIGNGDVLASHHLFPIIREMSSEVHARTRSSERLDGPPGGAGSTSPPTTTTSGAAAATATGGGGGSSATNVVGATKASSSSSSMLQFSEHAINQVQGLSKRGLDLPITARLQRRRYRWDFLLFLSSLVEASSRREHHRALLSRCVYRYISVCGYDDAMTR